MPTYKFTEDWFSNNIPQWTQLFKGYKKRPVKWLEIGTYEGRSAIWALENVLTHPKSTITCVDKWSQRAVLHRFRQNIAGFPDGKVNSIRAASRDALKDPELIKQRFDVVYIDADHHASSVLEDAVLAFPLIKPGGLMVFDDYTYSKEHDNRCPKQGIDAFLAAYAEEVHVISTGWQVVVQKLKKPRAKANCASEYFDK